MEDCTSAVLDVVMKAGKYAYHYFLCHTTVVATVLNVGVFSRSHGELQSKKIVAADKLTLIR